MNQQIEQVHSILGHRRKQREEKESIERQQENESWYKKITVLGLVLSLLGIIEVVSTLVETLGKELGLGFGVWRIDCAVFDNVCKADVCQV